MKNFSKFFLFLFLLLQPFALLASQKGNIYNHPSGISFWYPLNWKLHELPEAFQLVPSDVVSTKEGDSEVFFITGESIAGLGIFSADDPRVIEYTDSQVRSMLPSLVLQNKKQYIELMGTRGIVLSWKGNNLSGKPVQGRAYIVIAKDYALTLSVIALKGLIEKRENVLKKIFSSFALNKGKIDPALFGKWEKIATTSITNNSVWETDWSRASAVSDEHTTMTFFQDGTWKSLYTYHMIAGAGGIWLEDTDRKEHSGKWSADGKRLFMLYEDNTWNDYEYTIINKNNGKELRMSDGKKGQVWKQ